MNIIDTGTILGIQHQKKYVKKAEDWAEGDDRPGGIL